MRLFILTSSKFDLPRPVLCQKVLDIIELGLSSQQIHFYIVGDKLSDALLHLEQNNDAVTIIKQLEAEKLIKEVTNAIVIHFGAALKGSDQFPHYFIPLSDPTSNAHMSIFQKWSLRKSFKNYIQKSMATYAINEWAFNFLENKYKAYATKMQEAYLPITTIPRYEWVALADAKNKLTEGANYFLAFQPLEAFVEMLKEFSIFKKWQQTNMALVFIFENEIALKQAEALLVGYKFKESIVVHTIAAFDLSWLAATYAITFNNINFNKASIIEMAIQYDIPLLFNTTQGKQEPMPATWAGAGELFCFEEKGALSNHYKLYYKDEVYRQARARMGMDWLSTLYAAKKNAGLVQIPLALKS